jgi:hypothetical protein
LLFMLPFILPFILLLQMYLFLLLCSFIFCKIY